jgi:mRNA interferase HigB
VLLKNERSILKGGRVVFNIKANDYRLIAVVQYENGVMMIRFFRLA